VGFWEEASGKFDEYMEERGGYINRSRDAILNAKIKVGLAKVRGNKDDLGWANEALTPAVYHVDGSDSDQIANVMDDVVVVHLEKLVSIKEEYADRDNWSYFAADYVRASTEDLMFCAANALLRVLVLAADNGMLLVEINDNPHDAMQSIAHELLNRKEMEKVSPIVKKLLKADPTKFFQDVWEEDWKKKLS